MKIFAHRGASGSYPENTQSAIKAAVDILVDGIEVDVQSCLDDYMIIHDTWLDRTTSGRGKVNNLRREQIQQFDAGNGEYVPTLSQLLEWVNNSTLINLELKHTFSLDKFVTLIEASVAANKLSRDNLLVSSFDHHQLMWLKQQLPWVKIGALTASIPINYAEFAQRLHAYSIHIDKNFINHEFVADAKKRDLQVYAYTVDKQEDIEQMLRYGVDGIFTNYPCNTKMILNSL
ncbi:MULTISPECIES: glycerophosphodiester phosphodiesterase family protein [unclassified Pseudoalteromonas]|uniref:glycerophosphodiester phosphodiesterase n=1 Tax=unclassified Pseudoalteromonas TaxID=194690 RepID=UPI000C084710|nr:MULTISPECIES: glycerophosphodiester phosphodiesterase family protein [unclassified Pseudoalteromonas]MDP2636205.1 glycerophosphodiester phosphodiesterase family protein [Pseudoalteromonas sp. 1_MG-2023]PHN89448.1 glycerophosphodiester phosphodiesterase [Pseudoalteromonas sp. 3D05]